MQTTSFFHRIFRRFSSKLLILALGVVSSEPVLGQENSATTTAASVKITQPFGGQEFLPGESIDFEVEAFSPDGIVTELEIYSGTNLIRQLQRGSNPDPATPWRVSFFQTSVSTGEHLLTARAKVNSATVATSHQVRILVDSAARPTVSVTTFSYGSEPTPYADYARGGFIFERSTRLQEPLMIFYRTVGTASAGQDYVALPGYIVIPEGHFHVAIRPEEIDDDLVEGNETLTIELIPPPPETETQFPTNYLIGFGAATSIISDNEDPNAAPHLEIITPRHEQLLQQGSNIEFQIIARDPKGFIPKVQISHGNSILDTSIKTFDTPPAPGTPITHTLFFTNAPARAYQGIGVLGFDAAGLPVASNHVGIAVGPNPDRVTLGIRPYWSGTEASERLTNGLPAATSFYLHRFFGPTNQPVHYSLLIDGTAENGIDIQPISLTGVLEAGVAHTDIVINPIPDDLIEGTETLLVKLVDPQCWTTNSANDATNPACYMVSTNSQITFTIYDAPPTNVAGVVLSVEVVDEEASEAPLNGAMDTAKFRVRRVSGPLDQAVRFEISMSGEAWNGVDYQSLDRIMTMAPNQNSVEIIVRPIADNIGDGTESVILTLVDYNCGGVGSAPALAAIGSMPSCYDVAGPNVVQARILDSRNGNHPPRVTITYPPDGTVVEEGDQIPIQTHAFDHEGMLHSVVLSMDNEPIRSVHPATPGTGTNMNYTGQVLFTFTTNPPAGEHTLTSRAFDYTFMRTDSAPVRVLVRAKDATNVVSDTPLAFEQARTMADGTVRFKLSGGVGQVCRLETSSDLANWQLVSRVYLPNGELDYIDRQPAAKRYFRLLED